MEIVFSHTSASQAYRADIAGLRTGNISSSYRPRFQLVPHNLSPRISDVERDDLLFRLNIPSPVHSVCTNLTTSHRTPHVVKHYVSNLTEQDVAIRLAEGLWISSPEMLFLQMAEMLTLEKLIEFGFELCGNYSLPPEMSTMQTQYNVAPLTSASQIRAYLDRVSNRKHLKKARLAAKYVLDESRSPMETKAAMLLGLPRKWGGKGLGMPTMNYPIALNEESREIVGKRLCICDVMWVDQRVAVEYDSSLVHSGPTALREDSIRRNALEHMGIKVFTLTDKQIYNKEKFDLFATDVEKALGKHRRPTTENHLLQERILRKELLGK